MSIVRVSGGTLFAGAAPIAGDVVIRDGVITSVGGPARAESTADQSEQQPVIDASKCFVLPGFVDLQLNGGFGVDLTAEPHRLDEVARQLPATGVTSFLPTVISTSPAQTQAAIAALGRPCGHDPLAARSLGVHLEGPFIDPARRGAHPSQHIRLPSLTEAAAWTDGGCVAMVTLAPELLGAIDVIAALHEQRVVVCAGHTAVTRQCLDRAVGAGLSGATHLYNAMGSVSARAPGTIGAVLADDRITCGLIADGIHVDPTMVQIAWRILGRDRLALVTDAMAALGLPNGSYSIGDTDVAVDETGARACRDGVLAGSVLSMDQAVRNLIQFTGCSLADAATSASTTPATLLGRGDVGRLAVGRIGDLVLLDDELQVVATIIAGVVVHDPQQRCRTHQEAPWRS